MENYYDLSFEEQNEYDDLEYIARRFTNLIAYCNKHGIKIVHDVDGREFDFLGEHEIEYNGLHTEKKITIY